MEEQWKPLIYGKVDLSNKIEVSTTGKCRNIKTKKEYKYTITPTGYYGFVTNIDHRYNYQMIKVHRAVGFAFIPNPDNLPFINHIDGNKLNNNVENLEWCTPKQNVEHAIRTGLSNNFGENASSAKLSNKQVAEIRNKYSYQYITKAQLSKEYHMDPHAIAKIVNNISYKDALICPCRLI